MGVEGAAHATGVVIGKFRNSAGEAAKKAVTKTTELSHRLGHTAAEQGRKGVEGVKGKWKGATEAFRKGYKDATTPQAAAKAVDDVALGITTTVDTAPAQTSAAPEAGQNSTTAEGAEPEDKKTDEVDKAKAERQSKEKKFNENVTKRHQALVEQINKEYEHVEKDDRGYPKNEDERNEYFDRCAKANTEARTAELKATLQRDFEGGNPPPNQKEDPEAFREWLVERDAYMSAGQEAQQEAEEAAKKAESEAGQKKTQAENETEEDAEKQEDTSASMGNAFRLASELENAQDDEARKKVENKIQQIHDQNDKVRPRFKARVKIAQAVQIAKAVLLMGGMGVATEAVSKAASASAS